MRLSMLNWSSIIIPFLLGFSLGGCRSESKVGKAFRISDNWAKEFSKSFPNALDPYSEPPTISPVDLSATKNLSFFALNLPESEFNNVEPWVRSRMKQDSISTVKISILVPHPEYSNPSIIRGTLTFVFQADGQTSRDRNPNGSPLDLNPTFDGKPIVE